MKHVFKRGGGRQSIFPAALLLLLALEKGQVEELLITAAPDTLPGPREYRSELANQLVTKAQQTAARIRFIEDANLLRGVGGCGALLRFRV